MDGWMDGDDADADEDGDGYLEEFGGVWRESVFF